MPMEPEMLFEEIDIVMSSGACPRCNTPLVFDVSVDEWHADCPACGSAWGGSI
jgi:hypothetical protein